MEVKVRGGERLEALSRRLRQTKSKGLAKDLRKGINKGVRPVHGEIKRGIVGYMPSGYAPVLKKSLSLSTHQSARVGVQVRGKGKGRKGPRHVGSLERGRLRHLVWGRKPWVSQRVRPGFFSEPIAANMGKIRVEIEKVMDAVARWIARGG